jgi:N4-gp56 family major capsid protein
MSAQYNTYGDLGETIGVYAVSKLLKTAETKLVLDKFAVSESVPKNKGDQIRWRRIKPFPVSLTALTEGVTPAPTNIEFETVNADLYQYGAVYRYTDKAADLLDLAFLNPAIEEAAKQAALTKELLLWNTLKSAGTEFYTNGSANTDINTPIDADAIRAVIQHLDRNNATKVAKMIKAGPNFSTEPVRPGYIAVGHCDLQRDLEEMDGYIPVENYASYTPVSEYEVGSAYGTRFILTPHFTPDAGAGSATLNGMRNTSSAVDVYTLVIFGADAYASVALKGMDSANVSGTAPKMGTPGDELGQRGSLQWKMWHANTILNDDWIANIRCAATSL